MRQISGPAIRQVLARESGDPMVALMRITHAELTETIRVCADTLPLTRTDDGTYQPFPFEFILPQDIEGEVPRASVKLDNVSKEIARKLAELSSRPTCVFMLVLASQPDVVEYGPAEFKLGDASWNALSIIATLTYQEDVWKQRVPSQDYTPSNSPGVFR